MTIWQYDIKIEEPKKEWIKFFPKEEDIIMIIIMIMIMIMTMKKKQKKKSVET